MLLDLKILEEQYIFISLEDALGYFLLGFIQKNLIQKTIQIIDQAMEQLL